MFPVRASQSSLLNIQIANAVKRVLPGMVHASQDRGTAGVGSGASLQIESGGPIELIETAIHNLSLQTGTLQDALSARDRHQLVPRSTQLLMGTQIWISLGYLIPRVLGWVMLFGLALWDTLRHRTLKRRGWQLNRAILLVIGAVVWQDILLLAYAASLKSELSTSQNIFKVYIFFSDLADSLFIALLLAIAAGYCIIRETVGPYLLKVVLIPLVYLSTTLVVDYIIASVETPAAFFDTTTAQTVDVEAEFTDNEWVSLNLCEFASLIALLLAWVFIFDTVAKERELLEGPKEGIVGASGLQDPERGVTHTTTIFPPDPAVASGSGVEGQGKAEATSGHQVELPVEMVAQRGDMQPAEAYAPMQGEDTDQPQSVQDQHALMGKIRLMKQFMWGVAVYVIATALVILLPLFVMADPGEGAVKAIIILQNLVLGGFLAMLFWIFRLREDSPYLLLDEDAPAMHTELGVLSDANGLDEGPPESSRHQQRPYGAGTESPGSVDRNFSLGDLEDEEDDQHMLKDQTSSSSKPQQLHQEQGGGPGRQASRPASSQSSSPHARDGASTPRGEPSRPKKPSGKKD